jgi:uncharacterized membrane protein YdjX (TVP38/TMEM64 family)
VTLLLGLLGGAWGRLQGWMVAAAAAVVVIVGAFAAGRRGVRAEVERDGLRQAIGRREVRDAVERDVARDGDARPRLVREWSRD